MKTKNLHIPAILLVGLLIAYAILTVTICYNTKPAVSEGEFPFSITYEYMGKTGTTSGISICKFDGSQTIFGEHTRYWSEETVYTEGDYIVYRDETKTLTVQPGTEAGFLMGDPLYSDYHKKHYDMEQPGAYVEYYDYEKDISISGYHNEEELADVGFRVLDFYYGEPIENSFSFSKVTYEPDNIICFVALMIIFLLVCIIFVRKDKEYIYSKLDIAGIILNFIVGIVAVPFITLICTMFGLTGSGYDLIDQCIYNIPSFTILCLALSVMLRRKGYSKQGFFIQFGGIPAFVLMLLTDLI